MWQLRCVYGSANDRARLLVVRLFFSKLATNSPPEHTAFSKDLWVPLGNLEKVLILPCMLGRYRRSPRSRLPIPFMNPAYFWNRLLACTRKGALVAFGRSIAPLCIILARAPCQMYRAVLQMEPMPVRTCCFGTLWFEYVGNPCHDFAPMEGNIIAE